MQSGPEIVGRGEGESKIITEMFAGKKEVFGSRQSIGHGTGKNRLRGCFHGRRWNPVPRTIPDGLAIKPNMLSVYTLHTKKHTFP